MVQPPGSERLYSPVADTKLRERSFPRATKKFNREIQLRSMSRRICNWFSVPPYAALKTHPRFHDVAANHHHPPTHPPRLSVYLYAYKYTHTCISTHARAFPSEYPSKNAYRRTTGTRTRDACERVRAFRIPFLPPPRRRVHPSLLSGQSEGEAVCALNIDFKRKPCYKTAVKKLRIRQTSKFPFPF